MSDLLEAAHRLKWHGAFTFEELLTSAANKAEFSKPGVYLWIDEFCKPEKICYVGRATGAPDLWIRHWAHYISLIAGHYQLPGVAGPDGTPWEMAPANPAVIATVFEEDKYLALVRAGFAYAKHLRLFLCPLNAELVRMVERQLLYELQPVGTTWGRKTAPITLLSLIHESASWLTPSTKTQIATSVEFA